MNEKFMRAALAEALKGAGKVSPNPIVGAVVAKRRKIIGKGAHLKFGDAHAEINALRKTRGGAKNAEMYVTLEPCCHTGKTPPCTDAIIESGVKRVFVGVKDPNPKVNGKGIAKLRNAGIKVKVGVLEQECRALNEFYFKYAKSKIPFVILKTAISIDGKISTGEKSRKWITGKEARRRVHELRGEIDAVITGIGTVLADNPRLTCRIKGRSNPVRVVLDSDLKIPAGAKLLRQKGKTIIFCNNKIRNKVKVKGKIKKLLDLKNCGVEVVFVAGKKGRLDLKSVLRELGKRGVMSVLVEAGTGVNTSFLKERLIDRVVLFAAPEVFVKVKKRAFAENWDKSSFLAGMENARIEMLGKDLIVQGNF